MTGRRPSSESTSQVDLADGSGDRASGATEAFSARTPLALRRPTEDDHRQVAAVVDEWFGRRMWPLASRSWFRHFADTSWIVDGDRQRPAGFLIGYLSPSRPSEAVLHLVAVAPNHRRRRIGRALVTAFEEDARGRGAGTIVAVAWPEDRPAIAFFQALGFVAESGAGTQRLYGVDAYADYEVPGEDRAVLRRTIGVDAPDATG